MNRNQRKARRKKRVRGPAPTSTFRSTVNGVNQLWEQRRKEKHDTQEVVRTYESLSFA